MGHISKTKLKKIKRDEAKENIKKYIKEKTNVYFNFSKNRKKFTIF